MKLKSFHLILSIAALGLLASAAASDLPKVKHVDEKSIIAIQDGEQGLPSFLKAQRAKFDPPNAKIGEVQKESWGSCGGNKDILWTPKVYALFSGRFAKAFRTELENAHYPVPVVSDTIFEDSDKPKKESSNALQVGELIKDISANFCVKREGITGGVYMKIFWQLYSPEMQKVVFETTTEGYYETEGTEKGYTPFFEKAFAMATRNLLAEQGYHDVITSSKVVKANTAALETIKLRGAKATSEPLAKHITTLRSAVVTIVSDLGSGSGFFVSPDGYLLTNRHVVGDSKFVKVKLPTGRELVGEVIRVNKQRDIALIKTEPIAVQPIPVRGSELNIGEEVYALGSPLGDKFNTTLTRGILSGYRTMEEMRYLQSDVAILPGNSGGPLMDDNGSVVGITVSGLGAKGLAGMNFFIPIMDALTKLSLEVN